MKNDNFEVSERVVLQKKKVGLFNRKLKKEAKIREKQVSDVINDSEELKINAAKLRTLLEMVGDSEIKECLKKLVEMVEYARPSFSKDITKFDDKIAARIDDIKIMFAGNKSKDKIFDKIEELRIAIVERNNMCEAGV